MGLSHPFDRYVGGDAFRQVETVIRRFECTGAGPFPFMGITEPLAHGPANFGGFAGPHPDHGVGTGDVGKLELVDTGPGILGFSDCWIVKGRHVLGPANLLKFVILIPDGQLAEFFLSPLRSYGMPGYGRVSLADVTGVGKNSAKGMHSLVGQAVDALQLFE